MFQCELEILRRERAAVRGTRSRRHRLDGSEPAARLEHRPAVRPHAAARLAARLPAERSRQLPQALPGRMRKRRAAFARFRRRLPLRRPLCERSAHPQALQRLYRLRSRHHRCARAGRKPCRGTCRQLDRADLALVHRQRHQPQRPPAADRTAALSAPRTRHRRRDRRPCPDRGGVFAPRERAFHDSRPVRKKDCRAPRPRSRLHGRKPAALVS